MEVHAAGGGINFTVEKTRAASAEVLESSLLQRLDRMLRAGMEKLSLLSSLESFHRHCAKKRVDDKVDSTLSPFLYGLDCVLV